MLAKPPLAGLSKTRLVRADGLSAAGAAALSAAFIADLTVRLGSSDAWRLVVCCPRGGDRAPLQALVPATVVVWEEPALPPGRDFGTLMNAVLAAWTRPQQPVALIAADCPLVTPGLIATAFAALRRHAVVLGPDAGGGCWLLGATAPLALLGDQGAGPVVWSAGRDYAELCRRSAAAGLRLATLPLLSDVDTPADLRELARTLAAQPATAAALPATARTLRELGWLTSEGGGPCSS
ncbi:MAG: DUF2064 domain-containing protein [Fimbriimonadaceae bacterium]|nr:DUF2064 domain-containing protein [Fimbriimonadaceae bacterium]